MSDAAIEQKDLRTYLRPLLKRWWLFVLIVPVLTVATYLFYDSKPKSYESAAELYVEPATVQGAIVGGGNEPKGSVENYALLIQTSAVGKRAERLLAEEGHKGKQNPAQIPHGGVSAIPIEKSSFIGVTGISDTPKGAARLANAYSQAFVGMQRGQLQEEASEIAKVLERQLRRLEGRAPASGGDEGGGSEIEQSVQRQEQLDQAHRREALEGQIQNLRLIASRAGTSGAKVVEEALPPSAPTGHDPRGNAIFALVIGLLLATAAAYLLEYLSRRITRIEEVEDAYGLPILTEVPEVDKPAPSDPSGAVLPRTLRGPFQRLQANIELLGRDTYGPERPVRTILVASAAPREGKSVVARNLALAYREAGRNVALFDADFRKAGLARMLHVDAGPGLSDILAGRASFGQVVQEVQVQATSNGNGRVSPGLRGLEAPSRRVADGELALVPAGEDHGMLVTAFASQEMRTTLDSAADAYGVVIIDSPSLLAVADALPLLGEVDSVVLVCRLGSSARDSARRLIAELERMPSVNISGVVVNGISPRLYRARSYDYYDG